MIDQLTRFSHVSGTASAAPTEFDKEVALFVNEIMGGNVEVGRLAGWLSRRQIPEFAQNDPQWTAVFFATVHKFASLSFWEGRFIVDLFFNTDTYVGGGLAVGIKSVSELDAWFQVSTFLRGYPLHDEENAVWVKDYMEGAGLLRTLCDLGYLKDLHENTQFGFGTYRKAVYLGPHGVSGKAINRYAESAAVKIGLRG